jgi:Amidases related to nicotinamidase
MENIKITETDLLKAEKMALVVIDLQRGTVGRQHSPYTCEQVIRNANRLIDAFMEKGAFVVFVKVSSIDGKDIFRPKTDLGNSHVQFPKGWDRLVPELENHKNAYVIIKKQWGAFHGTDLDLQLRRRGIDTIVLCGITTSFGVDTTAREAYQHGYNQIFVEDAMSAATKEEHDYVCKHIFPKIGQIRATEEMAGFFASTPTQNI